VREADVVLIVARSSRCEVLVHRNIFVTEKGRRLIVSADVLIFDFGLLINIAGYTRSGQKEQKWRGRSNCIPTGQLEHVVFVGLAFGRHGVNLRHVDRVFVLRGKVWRRSTLFICFVVTASPRCAIAGSVKPSEWIQPPAKVKAERFSGA
jgi:hypothetical protein